MLWLDYLKQIYSLDTLDTRFTSDAFTINQKGSSSTRDNPVDPARASLVQKDDNIDWKGSKAPDVLPNGASPPRSFTPEYLVYYGFIAVALPYMFYVTYDISKESHPEYHTYSDLLSPGWIPGRKVDNSDDQYSTFRDNIPYLTLLLTVHPLLRRIYNSFFPAESAEAPNGSTSSRPAAKPLPETFKSAARVGQRLQQRVSFDFRFGIFFICALHGVSALKILFILYLNYTLATRLPRKYVPAATWIFNIGILFANEFCHGYPFAKLADSVLPWASSSSTSSKASESGTDENWGSLLDRYGGLIPRWEILFKVTMLRLVSFNLDYYWSLASREGSPVEKKQLDPANLSETDRVKTSAKPEEYSFKNYLAYALYSPVYLAGPILTFNDYVHQCRHPTSSVKTSRTILYGIRFLISLVCMELLLHYMYVVAISKARPPWEAYTPFQLSMIGFFILHIIWLKLLLPWRFFRLWALIDGLDPPENMIRCVANSCSPSAFWRAWHRSFNRWIVRYVYVPLGGSRGPKAHGLAASARPAINFVTVFTFVALWHDIDLRLLTWGWLITLFILPEVVAGYVFPKRRWENHKTAYRVLAGIGTVFNILMMMIANLVGFALGLEGVKGLLRGLVGSYAGVTYMLTACWAIYTAAQVMFEVRESELRRGIRLNC